MIKDSILQPSRDRKAYYRRLSAFVESSKWWNVRKIRHKVNVEPPDNITRLCRLVGSFKLSEDEVDELINKLKKTFK